jgi:hypothetical protein
MSIVVLRGTTLELNEGCFLIEVLLKSSPDATLVFKYLLKSYQNLHTIIL